MRLTEKELQAIKTSFKDNFKEKDQIWLFGSRVDDSKSGGDIDLYIETTFTIKESINVKLKFLVDIKLKIGDQKIDLILKCIDSSEQPIYTEAKSTGVKLK